MGRTKLPDGEGRTATIHIRVTDAEKAFVEREARIAGLTVTNWIMRKVKRAKAKASKGES